MGVTFVMGFSSGLPLLLTIGVLQAWMKEAGVDLGLIGFFSLVGLPYTLKFLWAPLFDRYTLPFLGRRRGWLLSCQAALALAILGLGLTDPSANPLGVAAAALCVTFFSASQDIVIDAYRREDLPERELGLGSSLYVNGYRVGMLLSSAGGLLLADLLSFRMVYTIMAACMLPGLLATLYTPEPVVEGRIPRTLREAVVDPLREYLGRQGAFLTLAFILFYKLGDTMAGAITTPFFLDLGFSKATIGSVAKLFGFWATLAGGFLGGILILRLGIRRCLWSFGILQAVSTAGFAILAHLGDNVMGLASAIAFENLTGGMGTSAFAAFMAGSTDKRFTATQYALLSSLMGVPRVVASAPTGMMAEGLGWAPFFWVCTLMALPGLFLLSRIGPRENG